VIEQLISWQSHGDVSLCKLKTWHKLTDFCAMELAILSAHSSYAYSLWSYLTKVAGENASCRYFWRTLVVAYE